MFKIRQSHRQQEMREKSEKKHRPSFIIQGDLERVSNYLITKSISMARLIILDET